MKRHLTIALVLLVIFKAEAQGKDYFKVDSNTKKYFRGAAVGTRRFAVNTDLVDLAYNGIANLGFQYYTRKKVGFEFVYGRPYNAARGTRILLPYNYIGEVTTRPLHSFQQSVHLSSGQVGLSNNIYVGLNTWQIFLEHKFPDPRIPLTISKKYIVNFVLGGQKTVLGPLQFCWEAGMGYYWMQAPDLRLYGFGRNAERGLSFVAKAKIGYAIW